MLAGTSPATDSTLVAVMGPPPAPPADCEAEGLPELPQPPRAEATMANTTPAWSRRRPDGTIIGRSPRGVGWRARQSYRTEVRGTSARLAGADGGRAECDPPSRSG